jgi:hypothetical protein
VLAISGTGIIGGIDALRWATDPRLETPYESEAGTHPIAACPPRRYLAGVRRGMSDASHAARAEPTEG